MALHQVGDVVVTSAGILTVIERIEALYPGCSEHYYRTPSGDLRSTSGAFLNGEPWVSRVVEDLTDGMLARYVTHTSSAIRTLAITETRRRVRQFER